MASTTALYTGLSGLTGYSRRLDVIGNNIANVNTTAYKSSRLMFESQFTRNLSLGLAPAETRGGTNPYQVGLGVVVSGTQRDFAVGSPQATGDPRDLMIDGDGFFVVQRGEEQFYTRNGAFRPDEADNLVSISGDTLLGYGVDAGFNVTEGALAPINVPLGRLRIAEATGQATIAGNLNADGTVAGAGSITTLGSSATTGLSVLASAGGGFITSSSLLVEVEDPLSAGAALFEAGQTLTFSGVTRGGTVVPDFSVPITAETTFDELISALNSALGIFDTETANPDGTFPGASVDPETGLISVVSNTGTVSALEIEAADVRLFNEDGLLDRLPLTPSATQSASGESRRTTMVVYDSLGTPVEVDVAFTLVERGASGTTWRYDVLSNDHEAGTGPFIGSGTVRFDTLGQLVGTDPISVSIDRSGTGADSPLVVSLFLSGSSGRMTSLTGTPTEFTTVARDGLPQGTLEAFSVADDGRVVGAFSNGAFRDLGQVVVAQFSNNEGLIDAGDTRFRPGANSGPPIVVAPGSFSAGQIVGGALELSNVDLGQEFINLILTSTGYSANTRIIQTTDDLIQQLLVLGR